MSIGTLILRADASVATGTGHVMRCLALAQAWQDAGGCAVFAIAETTPAVDRRLQSEAFPVVQIQAPVGSFQDADHLLQIAQARNGTWVAIDGYHFSAEYQKKLKDANVRLLCIDDNGEVEHYYADLVLNQNAHANEGMYETREAYAGLLLGPRYALLRREFVSWKCREREISAVGRNILVMMGGSDPDNVTSRVIEAIKLVTVEGTDTIVAVGGSNPHIPNLQHLIEGERKSIRLLMDVSNMPELMAWADVAVSGAGTTCWEMCLLGLPAILIDLADNQRLLARELASMGCAIHLGSGNHLSIDRMVAQLEEVMLSPVIRTDLFLRSRGLVDGKSTWRVVDNMAHRASLRIRPATALDRPLLWDWVNDPQVRASAFSPDPIRWDEHQNWFARKCGESACRIFIAENADGVPIGQFRADLQSDDEGTIDVSVSREARGSGYSNQLIDASVRRVFAETTVKRLTAFVKVENVPSRRAFERANFKNMGTETINSCTAVRYVRTREQGEKADGE